MNIEKNKKEIINLQHEVEIMVLVRNNQVNLKMAFKIDRKINVANAKIVKLQQSIVKGSK